MAAVMEYQKRKVCKLNKYRARIAPYNYKRAAAYNVIAEENTWKDDVKVTSGRDIRHPLVVYPDASRPPALSGIAYFCHGNVTKDF